MICILASSGGYRTPDETLTSTTLQVTTTEEPLEVQEKTQFIESIEIDHKTKESKTETSSVEILQDAAPKGMKMEVEIEKQETSAVSQMTKTTVVEARETHRQEVHMQVSESESEAEESGKAPEFTWPLISVKVMDGEEVKFKGVVTGKPMPELTWKHGDKVITDTIDFGVTYDKTTGVTELLIHEVFPEDRGEYECEAVNRYGSAISRATLQVECEYTSHVTKSI